MFSLITEHFSGPGRALSKLCVCADNNYWMKWLT